MKTRLLMIAAMVTLTGCTRIDPDKISLIKDFKPAPCEKKDKGKLAVDATGHMFQCSADEKWENADALHVAIPVESVEEAQGMGKCAETIGGKVFAVDCGLQTR
jgi:hypothetical protein